MKNGRLTGRSPRRRGALAMLARARPAALDADHATRSRWPGAEEIIAAGGRDGEAGQAFAESKGKPGPGETGIGRWARLGGGKLIGALSSGAVTAAAVGIAVIVGTMVLGSHGPPPRPPRSTIGHSSSAGRVGGGTHVGTFAKLPLLGDWHGHLAVAFGDGVVYLVGHASSHDTHGSAIATLPPGRRPATEITVLVSLGKAGDGTVTILPNGSIVPFSPHGDYSLVSLDGVSFPLGSG